MASSDQAANQRAGRERRARMIDLIRQRTSISVADLATAFNVSGETIRRDLRRLEERKLVARSYGVVHAVASGVVETGLDSRQNSSVEEKRRIAAEAPRHLEDARTIFIDEGYMPSLIAEALPAIGLTVLTTSLPVANAILRRRAGEVIMVGGRIRPSTQGVVDRWATDMLHTLQPDLAFVGANGITEDGWLTTPDPLVAAVKEAACQAARRRIFVGAHYKFGVSTFVRFAALADFEAVITGRELPRAKAAVFGALGPRVFRV
ncbi:MAG: DeoR/GlpR family DNA-binding transcription regulator [Bifidobacteriaceae bacterium]|jgi:DeoR/GlpR family transcriptional regulator of sugar metabolism|nr:DeoR/GlpR family DNA-binding transcription regulator [Bifidobacteriaceae bacterium]